MVVSWETQKQKRWGSKLNCCKLTSCSVNGTFFNGALWTPAIADPRRDPAAKIIEDFMIESIRYLSDVAGFRSLNDRINGGEVVEERVNGLRKGEEELGNWGCG